MLREKHHFEAKKGWINDPNGLIYYKGNYHSFYQHNPYSNRWGRMHWGHAISKDMVHFEELPIALYPKQSYESTLGCFSGSAIEKDGRLYLFYTTVGKRFKQTQSLAFSDDGFTFTKYKGNPIISDNPFGYKEFRDPKVFPYHDGYRMVVGTGDQEIGRVLLYASDDLLDWEYQGVLYESEAYTPCMECPDFYPLGDRYVLAVSKMNPAKCHGAMFIVGDFDGVNFTNTQELEIEAPGAFYAPQSFLAPDGRRIMLGWQWGAGRKAKLFDRSAGALSIPREMFFRDGKLCSYPIAEYQHLLTDGQQFLCHKNGKISVINTANTPVLWDESEIKKVEAVEDSKIVELFINNGERSYSFYKKKVE